MLKLLSKRIKLTFYQIRLLFKVKDKKMKKHSRKKFLERDEVNEMIESALRRHNRRSTIISSVLGWILIGGYSFGLFQAVQNV